MANRDESKRKKKKKTDITPFIIIGIVALVIIAVIAIATIKPALKITTPTFHKASITNGLTMGDANTPVKVVEFADFQCPGCGSYWTNQETTIVKNYVETGKVFYSYSPFSFVGTFVQNNPWDESVKAAEAAYCANDQGKFWDYRDYVFGNQQGENQGHFSRDFLLAIAKKLKLDMTTFTSCFDSNKYAQKITDDNNYAVKQGVNSTPSFTVNGILIDLNKTDLATAIEDALKK
jgi:protein-disulfide isomerase